MFEYIWCLNRESVLGETQNKAKEDKYRRKLFIRTSEDSNGGNVLISSSFCAKGRTKVKSCART